MRRARVSFRWGFDTVASSSRTQSALISLATLSLIAGAAAEPADPFASERPKISAQSQIPFNYDGGVALSPPLDFRDLLKSFEPRDPTETSIGNSILRFDPTRSYDDPATQANDINASPDAPNFRRLVKSRSKPQGLRVPYLGVTVSNPLRQPEDPLLPK